MEKNKNLFYEILRCFENLSEKQKIKSDTTKDVDEFDKRR